MVELWAYTSAYAARLADGAGSNPAGGTKYFGQQSPLTINVKDNTIDT